MLFEVWAPDADEVGLRLAGEPWAMERDPARSGWWTAQAPASDGDRYGFVLDGGGSDGRVLPDPRSRRQPDGPDGESAVVDHSSFAWRSDWPGRGLPGAVLYELHIGTYTEEGTFDAAAARLGHLAGSSVSPMCR